MPTTMPPGEVQTPSSRSAGPFGVCVYSGPKIEMLHRSSVRPHFGVNASTVTTRHNAAQACEGTHGSEGVAGYLRKAYESCSFTYLCAGRGSQFAESIQ